MTPERWQLVKAAFERAVELPSGERRGHLATLYGNDADLRREVESLLDAHEASVAFVDRSAGHFLPDALLTEPADRWIGRHIGAYEIIARLGRGGMGEVYRARRADAQYEQEVAIKVVRGGFDIESVLQRFRAERQILANLDHRNIARLLDGGATEDGLPYLVMELVDGEPIESYCVQRDLPLAARLRLFCDVCAAVGYAHQRLVVHRDLKPSNILVTRDGTVKLLDFGVAKLLRPAALETASAPTVTLMQALTPTFASPEQILGLPITTASDIYSLGVVLHHLLAGRSPYHRTILTTQDAIREVCEREPVRLSLGDRDLDAIALKALRKEPRGRYATVEQLVDDVRRHLAGLPVAARGDELGYRARKFLRRHRLGAAAALILLLAIGAGVAATLREATVARDQARIAEFERARTERRFHDVSRLSDALIFDINDAIRNLPGATPARQILLDRAVAYLDSVARDAAGETDLQRELAWGYQRLAIVQGSSTESSLGNAQAAAASNRKALAYFEAVAKADPGNVTDQINLAMMHRILSFADLAQEQGQRELERALDITQRLLAGNPGNLKVKSERSIEYQDLGLMQDAAGDRAGALKWYRANRDLKLEIMAADRSDARMARTLAMATVILGDAQAHSHQLEEGAANIRDGIARYAALPKGIDDINIARELAVSRVKYADAQLMRGDLDAAESNFREARAVLVPLADRDPRNLLLQDDVAWLDYHFGKMQVLRGHYTAAIGQLRRSLARFQQLHGPVTAVDETANAEAAIYLWLGDAYGKEGHWQAALASYRGGIAVLGTAPHATTDDDTRCKLALSHVRAAQALARLHRWGDAQQAAVLGTQIVEPSLAAAYEDVPALYVAAEGYARQAQILAARAGADAQVREYWQRSLAAWHRIPAPTSSVSSEAFLAFDPERFDEPQLTSAVASAPACTRSTLQTLRSPAPGTCRR